MEAKKVLKNEFYSFLTRYRALPWEEFSEKDQRFNLKKRYTNYPLENRRRFYFALIYALKYFSSSKISILDLGAYPGTWLRILREFLNAFNFNLYGAGICSSADFVNVMKEKVNASIMAVNLDPNNEQLKKKNYLHRIPLPDESMDFISCLEIIEHLHSPNYMLFEAHRLLKKRGRILITTPNVSRIGSIFKLLVGRSNYERIAPLDYYDESNEWRPHVWEYTMEELTGLLKKCGYVVIEKAFIDYLDKYFDVRSLKQRFADLCKEPFFYIPHFRDGILVIAEKP